MIRKPQPTEPEPVELDAAQNLAVIEKRILATLEHLAEFERTALDQARDEYRTAYATPCPSDPFGPVWQAHAAIRQWLPRYRPDLVPGAEHPPSKAREAVRSAEASLEHAEGLFVKRQGLLAQYRSGRGPESGDLLRLLEADARNIAVCRERLSAALAALPPDQKSAKDQDRRLELLQLEPPVIAVRA